MTTDAEYMQRSKRPFGKEPSQRLGESADGSSIHEPVAETRSWEEGKALPFSPRSNPPSALFPVSRGATGPIAQTTEEKSSRVWTQEHHDWWQLRALFYQRKADHYHQLLMRRGAQKNDPWLPWKYELARGLSQNPPEIPTSLCYGAPGWGLIHHPENAGIHAALSQWKDGAPINPNLSPSGEELFFKHYAPLPGYYPKLCDRNILEDPSHVLDFLHLFANTNVIEPCAGDCEKTVWLLDTIWKLPALLRQHAQKHSDFVIPYDPGSFSSQPLTLKQLGAQPASLVVNDMINDFAAADEAFKKTGIPKTKYETNVANILTDEYYQQDFFARNKASDKITTVLMQGNSLWNFTPEQREFIVRKHIEALQEGAIRIVPASDNTLHVPTLEKALDLDICNQIIVNAHIFADRKLGMNLPGRNVDAPFEKLGARREINVISPNEVLVEMFSTTQVQIPDPTNPGQTKPMDVEILGMRRTIKSIGKMLEEFSSYGCEVLSIMHAELRDERYQHVNYNWPVLAA